MRWEKQFPIFHIREERPDFRMLVILEGIDGSGKTTVAKLVSDKLSNCHANRPTDKKCITSTDDYAIAKLAKLRDIIWSDNQPQKDPFTTYFWLKLIAAWYSHIEPKSNVPTQCIRLYDGWFYRNLIKSSLRCNASLEWLEALFDDVATPDVTVLLDIAPHIAWERDKNKKNTELGRWDGFEGSDKDAFCAYQEVIRGKLLLMAEQREWIVVPYLKEDTPAEMSDRITKELAKKSIGSV